ncbi:two-component system, sensor histidine kinase YcbA [Evansella caseinilytica]|uniref:histidine kinase n=1 Tax=Evansella caseinilytica TaxID=1503961 RepID=A0A1H3TGB0_9BACI|nr:sensor histidine kinase [Evansella caseinilytica]SDZ49323.1 two-component system, sensor histidine kinase YcbA [Evansella caseinilytica]
MRSAKMKRIISYIIFMILVPVAGEFQFYPLAVDLRVSFATPVLLLLLLYFKTVNAPLVGLLTGISVVTFRVILGLEEAGELAAVLPFHLPVLGYYLTYGVLFHVISVQKYTTKPVFIGLFACLLEISSSASELLARYLILDLPVTANLLATVMIVAMIRSFFVMGIYMMFLYRELQVRERAHRKKNDEILLVISDLYVELIQLKKSIHTSESATFESYYLSKKLQDQGNKEFSRKLLQISGKMHECKKDGQRIYASLSNLINRKEFTERLPAKDIIFLVERINTSYAAFLKKEVDFDVQINCPPVTFHSYFLLSILNNLVANAVESIEGTGKITIVAKSGEQQGYISFSIVDNGPGIPEKFLDIIFSPGFTTKFNDAGVPSNGIGLSHIKQVIEEHYGKIDLVKSVAYSWTEFNIHLPVTLTIEEGIP